MNKPFRPAAEILLRPNGFNISPRAAECHSWKSAWPWHQSIQSQKSISMNLRRANSARPYQIHGELSYSIRAHRNIRSSLISHITRQPSHVSVRPLPKSSSSFSQYRLTHYTAHSAYSPARQSPQLTSFYNNNIIPKPGLAKRASSSQPPKPSGRSDGIPHGSESSRSSSGEQNFLRSSLPDLSGRFHRPTKEELLAAATGFWSRLRVRFKWFSIRSLRPFNMDDISAFFSWILLGHVIWIVVGTTTFFSLLILAVNTVFAQETLARWVGNYLTKSSGVKVVFESAIVPRWKDGVISFKNVFVSRRPGQKRASVSKGSPESAAAATLAERTADLEMSEDEIKNYTQFDLSIETVNVTLSFTKWFNSKGLLRDVEVKGIRGVIDRSSIEYTGDYVDPRSYKYEHSPGDFEIDSFKIDDLLVSVHQPNNFRPYSVSIFTADLPQLRKQWLFYDFLSANHIHGSFDESLFTIHPRQTHNYTGVQLKDGASPEDSHIWKKQSRLRIDNLKIDHLNRGVEGPFSWIREGNVDIVADIMFPADNDESLAKVMSDVYDRMEATVNSARHRRHSHVWNDQRAMQSAELSTTETKGSQNKASSEEDNRLLIMDLRVHLNDVQAFVPIFTRDLSYVNNALIRPIVAYINSKKQFIPVNCRVVKKALEFDGSWTIYDSGLMDDLSIETYEAFVRDVVDDQARMRRIKKVGLWSLQLAIQALFLGLAGNVA